MGDAGRRQGLLLLVALLLCASALEAQGLTALGKYGPDGIPFTPDDPLEAKANVWGTKISLSALHRYEHPPANEEASDAQSTDQGQPFEASTVLLTSADFNAGYPGLDLYAYNLHPDTPGLGEDDPSEGGLPVWTDLTARDTAGPAASKLHDLSPISAVVNNGENIEFSAPALASVCWRNGVTPGQNEDVTDFASHLKLNWKPRAGGSGDVREMTEPPSVKSIRFVRMKNAHIAAQGACIFNLETGGVALNTMFHFGFLGAAAQLNPDISELVAGFAEEADLKTKIKEAIEDKVSIPIPGLSDFIADMVAKSAPELVEWLVESYEDRILLIGPKVKDLVPDEFKPMIRTLRRVLDYEWFETIADGDDLHLTLKKFSEGGTIPPEAVEFAVAAGSLDAVVREALRDKMDETTWQPWKDCTHPFQASSMDLATVEQYFDDNREASALVGLRDDYPNGFTWNRGSLYRTANLYVIGKRRDKKDAGAAGENEWVELVQDVGAQMVTVRMTSVDPYRTRELMPGDVAGWSTYPTDPAAKAGFECFDLATLKTAGFNAMSINAGNKMLPVPWPFPNWAGGQGIIVTCAAGGGHYSKPNPSTESNVTDRSNDLFLPREMLFYIGCYNPYGHPNGVGSFDYWGFRFSNIVGPFTNVSDLNAADGEVLGFRRLWVKPNPELVAPSGPIRFLDAAVANGHLAHVSPDRHPQPTRQFQFFWDYDSDGTVDNHEIANTSHNFGGTSTTTLFTVDWDKTGYTGTGKTGMFQLPVFAN